MSFAECRKENTAGENGEGVGAGEGSLVPASAGQIKEQSRRRAFGAKLWLKLMGQHSERG